MDSALLNLESLVHGIGRVHNSLCVLNQDKYLRNAPGQKEALMSKCKRLKYSDSGFEDSGSKPVYDFDTVETNGPNASSVQLASSAVLELIEKCVVPAVENRKTACLGSYIQPRDYAVCLSTVMVCFARTLCGGGSEWGGTSFELGFISDTSSRQIVRSILKQAEKVNANFNGREQIDHPTLAVFCTALRKCWHNISGSLFTTLPTGGSRQALSLVFFIRTWRKLVGNYVAYRDHESRDMNTKFILATDKTQRQGYTSTTEINVIRDDYYLNLLAELLLCEHINAEWKVGMCKNFYQKHAWNMLCHLTGKGIKNTFSSNDSDREDVENSGRENIQKTNEILPTAAHFWDFCRNSKPPSEIRSLIVFDQCSSNPLLSSGAGSFGRLTGGHSNINNRKGLVCEKEEVKQTIKNLSAFTSSDSIRRWREQGNITCVNFTPVTLRGATQDFASLVFHGLMTEDFWFKRIYECITESVKSSVLGQRTLQESFVVRVFAHRCLENVRKASKNTGFDPRVTSLDIHRSILNKLPPAGYSTTQQ